ncbi:MAG: T9SS type A sorting domain-containing protein [Flavobacteriales bacterium]
MAAALVAATSADAQQPFDLDPTFSTTIQQQYVASVLLVEGNKLIVSGDLLFSGDDQFSPRTGARLNPDGSRDPAFTTYPEMGGVIKPWNDKIYCASTQTVRRFNMNGSVDPSFIHMNSDPHFSSLQGGDYHVFPDGRVLMSGAHTLNDPTRGFLGLYNLIWFSNTGYLDTTRIHRKSNGNMFEFEALPDGRFVCSTQGTTYEGQPVSRVFRIEADGALDPSFSVPLQNWGFTQHFEGLQDQRIMAAGSYRLESSVDTVCLLRLMPDGGLDPTFTPVSCRATYLPFSYPYIYDCHILPDGRMIVAGNFDRVQGVPRGGIALLDANGILLDDLFADATCGPYTYGGNTYRWIGGMVPGPEDQWYIYGAYHGYDDGTTNDIQQRFVSRLYGLDVGMQERQPIAFKMYPNPTSIATTIELEQLPTQGELRLRDALGRVVQRQRITDHYTTLALNGAGSGVYTVEVWDANGRMTTELLVVE